MNNEIYNNITEIKTVENFVFTNISSGSNHIMLSNGKNILTCGNNKFGQLGAGFYGDLKINEISLIAKKSPLQPNNSDCGVYMLKNLEIFIKKEENSENKYENRYSNFENSN
jgi:alpha-tubulin suppressor-like RCC1 family protein